MTAPDSSLTLKRRTLSLLGGVGALGFVGLQGLPVLARAQSASESAPLSLADLRWLNRVSGGVTEDSVADLARLGRSAWLAAQLAPPKDDADTVSDEASIADWMQRRQEARAATRAAQPGDAEATARAAALQKADRDEVRDRLVQARTTIFREAVLSPQVLREQMLWFWLNHFSVFAGKDDIGAMAGDYARTLRPLALGSFRDLLRATVLHPAMQAYLDNTSNRAGKINENYARELMELHTLGLNQGYTQQDVQEMARVLTGLELAPGGQGPQLKGKLATQRGAEVFVTNALAYNPARHDYGSKTLLGITLPGEGWPEFETIITRLASSPATATHLSRQLYSYFVADDAARAPKALIERLSRTYLESQGDIASVLRVLLTAPELDAALGQRLRSPWQYSVALVRTLAQTLPVDRRSAWVDEAWRVPAELNEELFGHRTPEGYPLDSREWLTPVQMAMRVRIAQRLAARAAAIAKAAGAVPTPLAQLAVSPLLSPATRATLAAQDKPVTATALLLSSPEFMRQ
ncbi:DUF1800 domain-containing protein [Amphibiibacter pelophylacis]|uniref:DUF1800 domain-containing protein n=1 Tax=Amphibiibacter pelophylacis TaxID=1799477 RepID=A0ACC6P3P5_9BURK